MRPDLDPDTAPDLPVPDPRLGQRLRALPDALPPYGYGEFSRRLARRRQRRDPAPLRLLAAALAVVVVGWVMKHGPESLTAALAMLDGTPAAAPSQSAGPASMPVAAPLAANAERWLNAQPRRAIVRVPTQMAVTELEDQIAAIDDQLTAVGLSQSQAGQLAILQRDRAQLVESLAQVRYAQILVAGVQ
jgi:hypothetical protein